MSDTEKSHKILESIVDAFCDWYIKDEHSSNRDYYKFTITKDALSNQNEEQFKKFFISFVREGGKVQSRGHRNIDTFSKTLNLNYSSFRKFVLEPFALDFNIEDWFRRIDMYPGFGVGIASIFLNRTNSKSFLL